ncbi:MAG: tetratricopeptide repeat protein [Campylobacterota bacterium]|nr:tetratricopeptide repeat protein [Campylobacterota bacterium]
MKRLTVAACLVCTSLYSSEIKPSQIDISKKGIALGTFKTLKKAKKVARGYFKYDIYIKQTTTTKRPYFVIYAVNINKIEQYPVLKNIKKTAPSAYITSDSRIKKLHNTKKIQKNKTINKINISKDTIVETKTIAKTRTNTLPLLKNSFIDISKKSIAIGTFRTIKKAKLVALKYKNYDTYIKQTTTTKKPYFVIYIVNIKKSEQYLVLKDIKKTVPSAYITSDSRTKQLSKTNDANPTTYTKKVDIKEYIKEKKLDFIDPYRDALTITYTQDLNKARSIAKELNDFTIYIRTIKLINENGFMIYAVNIPKKSYQSTLNKIQKSFPDTFKSSKYSIHNISKNLNKNGSFLFFNKDESEQGLISNKFIYKKPQKKETANLKYKKAKQLFIKKEYSKSIEILEELYDNNKKNFGINFYLARAYYETKEYKNASSLFNKIDTKENKNLHVKLELSQTYFMLKDYINAKNKFNEVLENNIPKHIQNKILNRIKYINCLV